jgi:hypothetical protein
MEYDAATTAFSEAVKELNRRIGTSPKEEYRIGREEGCAGAHRSVKIDYLS